MTTTITEQTDAAQSADTEPSGVERLLSYIDAVNIADELDTETLSGIGRDVLRGYKIDKASRSEWDRLMGDAMKLALQVAEAKSFPWPNAANVKYPLITTAAIQWAARAYPAIVQSSGVAKGKVVGADPDGRKKERADRIGQHMSYQLAEEMEEWEEDTDRLLLNLAIVGCAFRLTYYDPTLGRNVSEFVPAKDVYVNHGAKSLERSRRVTRELELYENDIEERVRAGRYREVKLQAGSDDPDASHWFLEQHCWLDLDDDGYREPYCVTVYRDSGEVARIVARYDHDSVRVEASGRVGAIQATEYYTKYSFIPNPDGGFYDIGLGMLLSPLSATIDTVLNQMLDAGTLQNAGGGFIGKGLRLRGGPMRFAPGEFKQVDATGAALRENIVMLPAPGPSPVLFQLLGLLIEAARDVANTKDVLSGEQQQANVPATTTLALIEQGMKVFTAIFKRVHRSLKQELRKLYRLNRRYLQPEQYFRVMDVEQRIGIEDYRADEADVVPVSDPNLVTDAQELARAQALMGMGNDPYINPVEVRKRFLKALKEENPDALLIEKPEAPPDPKATEMVAKLEILEHEAEARIAKLYADAQQSLAGAAKAVAEAEAVEIGNQLALYQQQVQGMFDALMARIGTMDGQGSVSGMGEAPGHAVVPGVSAAVPAADGGLAGVGGVHAPDDGGDGAEVGGGDRAVPAEPGVGDAGV